MAMKEAILGFFKQFEYEPVVTNSDKLTGVKKFVVAGMGGSHFAADFLLAVDSSVDLVVHKDYGLPTFSQSDLESRFIICSSYSGNTEEVIGAFCEGREKGLAVGAISVGGKLLELAKEANAPYVKVLDTGIQPRLALGFSFMALLKMIGRSDILEKSKELAKLKAEDFEKEGRELASELKGFVPIIYSSARNSALAFNWKIGFNETAKIPAFWNIFPELNHNEMTGFDAQDATRDLSQKFSFVFLMDSDDHPKTQKRMEITKKLYEKRGLPVHILSLKGDSRLEKLFVSSVIADWTAYHLGEAYGVETEEVPMVEEFKGLIGD